jgi:hypothetical protein
MTGAAKDIIRISYRLDTLKQFIGNIKKESYLAAFSDENFSGFVLYYVADKYFGDIYELEIETINITMEKYPKNRDKLKALVSTMQSDAVWTNAFAFSTAVSAFNNLDIDPTLIPSRKPDELAWGMANIAGLEGAIGMPFKTKVLGTIAASLMDDGWTAPPLFLMFKNVSDYFDNDEYIENIKQTIGHLTLKDIVSMNDFSGLGIDGRPDLKNYLARTQEYAHGILKKYNKLQFDWETAISGGVA